MTRRSIEEYAATIRPPYRLASRKEKARFLAEVCRVTGYHRKSAIRLLRRQPRPAQRARGRPRRYGPEVIRALRQVWDASDYLCSKRLAPFLPELVRILEHQGELRLTSPVRTLLVGVSAATIDRLLRPHRPKGLRRPHHSDPSHPTIQASIPIRTFADWAGVRPGALQADLVAHCGESLAGFFLYSLVAVDVATSWTECRPVWGRTYKRVGTAVHLVRQRLPFPLRELHTDNGGEFVNQILFPWCRREGIHFTRGRPYRKNDQAYAEQKIWMVVRRLVGYDRYSTRSAYEELSRLYELFALYLNFFQPIRKLIAKRRVGARVSKRYDQAQTPYQRLQAAGILNEAQRAALEARYLHLNPIRLREQIDAVLRRLWKLADHSGR